MNTDLILVNDTEISFNISDLLQTSPIIPLSKSAAAAVSPDGSSTQLDTGKLEMDPGEVSADLGKILSDTKNITTDTGKVMTSSENITIYSGKVIFDNKRTKNTTEEEEVIDKDEFLTKAELIECAARGMMWNMTAGYNSLDIVHHHEATSLQDVQPTQQYFGTESNKSGACTHK